MRVVRIGSCEILGVVRVGSGEKWELWTVELGVVINGSCEDWEL